MSQQLQIILGKKCVIGLSYFDAAGLLIKQNILAGMVGAVSEEDGITIELTAKEGANSPHFILPADLAGWFAAPPGRYHTSAGVLEDPDFLVTWDIYQTRSQVPDGTQQWWEWRPRLVPPEVGER